MPAGKKLKAKRAALKEWYAYISNRKSLSEARLEEIVRKRSHAPSPAPVVKPDVPLPQYVVGGMFNPLVDLPENFDFSDMRMYLIGNVVAGANF